jgi:uncharacterized membrane protein
MKQFLIIISISITAFHYSAHCQDAKFIPSFSVTMDASKAHKLLDQCSRSTPKNIRAFWTPTQSEIEILESSFTNIKNIVAKECCVIGAKIDSLQEFGFQYLGVIIKGEKYIYINAFPFEDITRYKKHNYDPATTPVIVCDGGTYYWGAIFDPQTRKFSSLSFNGYA